MNKDGRGNLNAAMAKAQGEMTVPKLDKVNPHFKSKYASLESVRAATIPALSANGIRVFQYTEWRDPLLVHITKFCHSSGEFDISERPVIADLKNHHATESAITYARRSQLSGGCCVSADEDDDGNAAQDKPKSNDTFGGPLNKTELKKHLRAFAGDLAAVEDEDTLSGVLLGYKAVIEQCERDLPDWFHNKDGNGLSQAINDKRAELGQAMAEGEMI